MVTLNMLRIALCLTIFSFSLSPLAFATDAPKIPDIPKPLNVMPSKIKPVQDGEDELSKAAPEGRKLAPPTNSNELEILSPLPDYGFQSDFADNLSRSDINEFFSKPSKASLSAGARKLALKFALTSFSLMSNEDKFPENIYGLRLNTLLNLGLFLMQKTSINSMNLLPRPLWQHGLELKLYLPQSKRALLALTKKHSMKI
jgi:hypothetical protein